MSKKGIRNYFKPGGKEPCESVTTMQPTDEMCDTPSELESIAPNKMQVSIPKISASNPKKDTKQMEELNVDKDTESNFPVNFKEFIQYTNISEIVETDVKSNKKHLAEQYLKDKVYMDKMTHKCYLNFYINLKLRKVPALMYVKAREECPPQIKEKIFEIPEQLRKMHRGRRRNGNNNDLAEADDCHIVEETKSKSEHNKNAIIVPHNPVNTGTRFKDSSAKPAPTPPSLTLFKKFVNFEEDFKCYITRLSQGDSSRAKIYENDENIRKEFELMFYKKFYTTPDVRKSLKWILRPCPRPIKKKILTKTPLASIGESDELPSVSNCATSTCMVNKSEDQPSFNFNYPVSLETFKAYTYYEEIVDEIFEQIPDKSNYLKELKSVKEKKNRILCNFYEAFYRSPKIRNEYKIKLKPCSKHIKDRILKIPEKLTNVGTAETKDDTMGSKKLPSPPSTEAPKRSSTEIDNAQTPRRKRKRLKIVSSEESSLEENIPPESKGDEPTSKQSHIEENSSSESKGEEPTFKQSHVNTEVAKDAMEQSCSFENQNFNTQYDATESSVVNKSEVQPSSNFNYPVSLETFKAYTYYEEIVDEIFEQINDKSNCSKELKSDEEKKNRILCNFYEAFYRSPQIRNEYKIKLKPCSKHIKDRILKIPEKLTDVGTAETKKDTVKSNKLPSLSSTEAPKRSSTEIDNAQTPSRKRLKISSSEENSLEENYSESKVDEPTSKQSHVKENSPSESKGEEPTFKQSHVNMEVTKDAIEQSFSFKNHEFITQYVDKRLGEIFESERNFILDRIKKIIIKSSVSPTDINAVSVSNSDTLQETAYNENNLTTEGRQLNTKTTGTVTERPEEAICAQTGQNCNCPADTVARTEEKINMSKENSSSKLVAKSMEAAVCNECETGVDLRQSYANSPEALLVSEKTAKRTPEIIELVQSSGNATQEVSHLRENSANYSDFLENKFFIDVDKNFTLAYAVRNSFGLKRRIIRALMAMNRQEFFKYTRIHGCGENIYQNNDTLDKCYEFVMVEQQIWPPVLYMRPQEIMEYLFTKGLVLEVLNFENISPKFLDWEELSRATNFDEIVVQDYFKETGKKLDNELLPERRQHFYEKCWAQDEWLWQVPTWSEELLIIRKTFLNEHLNKNICSVSSTQVENFGPSMDVNITAQNNTTTNQVESSLIFASLELNDFSNAQIDNDDTETVVFPLSNYSAMLRKSVERQREITCTIKNKEIDQILKEDKEEQKEKEFLGQKSDDSSVNTTRLNYVFINMPNTQAQMDSLIANNQSRNRSLSTEEQNVSYVRNDPSDNDRSRTLNLLDPLERTLEIKSDRLEQTDNSMNMGFTENIRVNISKNDTLLTESQLKTCGGIADDLAADGAPFKSSEDNDIKVEAQLSGINVSDEDLVSTESKIEAKVPVVADGVTVAEKVEENLYKTHGNDQIKDEPKFLHNLQFVEEDSCDEIQVLSLSSQAITVEDYSQGQGELSKEIFMIPEATSFLKELLPNKSTSIPIPNDNGSVKAICKAIAEVEDEFYSDIIAIESQYFELVDNKRDVASSGSCLNVNQSEVNQKCPLESGGCTDKNNPLNEVATESIDPQKELDAPPPSNHMGAVPKKRKKNLPRENVQGSNKNDHLVPQLTHTFRSLPLTEITRASGSRNK